MTRAHRPPSLRRALADLLGEADIRGRAGPKHLAGGAHLEALSKVEAREGAQRRRRQLRISRVGVAPSATEVAVFRRDGEVPPWATEAAFVQADGTHVVAVTWEVAILALPTADLPEMR